MDYNSGVAVRVKRGMVFWYDNNGGGDKTDVTVEVLGKKKLSRVIAGKRPWVVVSSDEMNENSSTCNIVPITTTDKEDAKYVQFIYNGRIQTVLTNQGTTVDSFVLREYECFLTDIVMDKIQEGIMRQFGIKINKEVYREAKAEVEESSQITMEMEEVKPLEVKKVAVAEVKKVAVEEVKKVAVAEVKKENMPSAVDKFNRKYAKYFNGKETETVVKPSGKRNEWDENKAKQLVKDVYNLENEKVLEKYGFKNKNSLHNAKSRLTKRYNLEG